MSKRIQKRIQKRASEARSKAIYEMAYRKSNNSRKGIVRLLDGLEARELEEKDMQARWSVLLARGYRKMLGLPRNEADLESLPRVPGSGISRGKQRCCAEVLKQLLIHLEKQGCRKLFKSDRHLAALFALARAHRLFRRDPMYWRKRQHNIDEQLMSLVRHSLCDYPVPAFFDSAWLTAKGTARHRYWFYLLGTGHSARKLPKVPIELTRKMAHLWLSSPHSFSIEQGLRRAQALALGASEATASSILASRIGRNRFADESFWESVVQFFANPSTSRANAHCVTGQALSLAQVCEMVDYIHFMRGQNPGYSMKGRTAASLVRQSDEWHREMSRSANDRKLRWPPSGFEAFHRLERNDENAVVAVIAIEELTSSRELQKEGRTMRSCVASYDLDCYDQSSAIFSLRHGDAYETPRSRVTIEVDLEQHEITQALARGNKPPKPGDRHLIRQWSRSQGLTISAWAFDG